MINGKLDLKKNYKFLLSAMVLLLFIWMQNCFTPYAADDYSFMFSWEDGTRITSLGQIFETLGIVYNTLIGRMVSVFFCIFFLMFPKGVFNVVNTLLYFATVCLVYKLTGKKRPFSAVIFFTIPALFWICSPTYGQLYLWLNGSINYLWSYFFALLFLVPYIALFRNPQQKRTRIAEIGLSIYGFLFGGYVENVSFATAFVCFLMVVAVMYETKQIKKYLSYVYPIVAAALGFIVAFLLSPGEMATHTGTFQLGTMVSMLVSIFTAYYKFGKTLLLFWAIMMTVAVKLKADRKEIILSVFYLLISVVSALFLCAGSYLAERSLGVSIFFLIVSNINLMQALRHTSMTECVAYAVCWYYLIMHIMLFWNGAYDIYDTYNRFSAREAYIIEQAEFGAEVVVIPHIEPSTSFCGLYGLEDVKTESSGQTWPNGVMARYYGLDMIYRQE